ncbi:36516_t:CDS:2, partial [Racocetra persica]
NSKDEIREDKQRVYQIFNELTDGFFDELVENPEDQSLVKNLQDLKEQITEALEKYRREDPTIPLEQLAQHFQKADFTDVPGLLEKMLKKTKK